MFVDYQVAGVAFDHGLDIGLFVSGDDQEPERVLPHRFEGGPVDLDRNHAAGLRALAKQRQQLSRVVNPFFEVCDVDVHLAEERFVADGPLFRRRHDGSLQRYSCTPRLSRLHTGRHARERRKASCNSSPRGEKGRTQARVSADLPAPVTSRPPS